MHQVQLLDQIAVVRSQVNLLMKSSVGAGQCVGVAEQLAVFFDQTFQHADFFNSGVAGGKSGHMLIWDLLPVADEGSSAADSSAGGGGADGKGKGCCMQ